MIAERNPQSEPEREIAAPAEPQTIENKGGDEGAEAPAKPDPTKIKTQYPPGEFSPTIYPEGWPDRSKRRGFKFKRETIRGKPLSETVMEDRGPEMPDPAKRKAKYPPGEFSPTIYPEGGGDPATRRPYDFPLIKIRGKPLSETVMEDRQAGW